MKKIFLHSNKYLNFRVIALIVTVFLFIANNTFAQKFEPETEFKYQKNTDHSRTLTYIVKYVKADDKNRSEATGIPITFSTGINNEKLATINTDSYGIAQYTVPKGQRLPVKDGKYTFSASIDDNSIVESKIETISLVDLGIEMKLELKDSIKTILFKAFEINENGLKNPVQTDLVFYVPRTFSKLKVAEGSTDEEGKGELEFPNGIPGDSLGNLTVLGRVEENEKYANVEISQSIQWGVPTNYHVAKFRRALWTTVAPNWMIITLTILLLGVWGHYIFVVYKLIRIRKEIKRNNNFKN